MAHIGQTAPTLTANAVFLWTSGPDQAVIRIALNEEKGFPHRGSQGTAAQGVAQALAALAGDQLLMPIMARPPIAAKRAKQVAVSFEPADVINQVMSFGSPTPVEVVISGPNQEDNRKYADKVLAEMEKIPTLRDLQFGQAFDYPRIKVEIDRERAGLAGLTVAEAANAMIAATSSSRYIYPGVLGRPQDAASAIRCSCRCRPPR